MSLLMAGVLEPALRSIPTQTILCFYDSREATLQELLDLLFPKLSCELLTIWLSVIFGFGLGVTD